MTSEIVYCSHVETEPGVWICPNPRCRHRAKTSAKPGNRVCGTKGPSLIKKAANFGQAMTAAVVDGFAFVTADQLAERNDICQGCEWYDDRSNGCRKCGCPLSYKPRLRSATCPANKWPTVTQRTTIDVVIVSPAANMGGAERWMVALGELMPAATSGGRPVRVTGFVIATPTSVDHEMHAELKAIAPVIVDRSEADQQGSRDLVAQADAVIVWGMGDARRYVGDFQGPIVWVSHGTCEWTERFIREARDTGIITHWASVSNAAKQLSYPDDLRDRVTVIENGAEIERTTPVRGRAWQREQWGIKGDQIAVGFIGRLAYDKRPMALPEALKHLPANYVGVLVGDGHARDETIRDAKAMAGQRIVYGGRSNLVGDALAALDCWLLASPSEGFCLARVEAHLAGVPVVCTPTGDAPKLEAENGQMYWSIPVGATGQEIAKQILLATQNTAASKEICDRAKQVSYTQHTAAAMAGRWVDYLKCLVK